MWSSKIPPCVPAGKLRADSDTAGRRPHPRPEVAVRRALAREPQTAVGDVVEQHHRPDAVAVAPHVVLRPAQRVAREVRRADRCPPRRRRARSGSLARRAGPAAWRGRGRSRRPPRCPPRRRSPRRSRAGAPRRRSARRGRSRAARRGSGRRRSEAPDGRTRARAPARQPRAKVLGEAAQRGRTGRPPAVAVDLAAQQRERRVGVEAVDARRRHAVALRAGLEAARHRHRVGIG